MRKPTLKSRARRKALIATRNEIRCDADGAGQFSTPYYIPGGPSWRSGTPDLDKVDELETQSRLQNIDLVFLDHSRRGKVIFSAEINTLAWMISKKIKKVAQDATFAALSESDRILNDQDRLSFEDETLSNGTVFSFLHVENAPILKSLGQKTEHGHTADILMRYAQTPETWPYVPIGAQFNKYGELILTVDETHLHLSNVLLAIDQFRSNGRKQYEVPVFDMSGHEPVVQSLLYTAAYTLYRLEGISQKAPLMNWDDFLDLIPIELQDIVKEYQKP